MNVIRTFFYAILLTTLTQGCVSSGKSSTVVDKFSGISSNLLTLGKIKTNSKNAGITENTMVIGKDNISSDEYYFILNTYNEGTGKDCPGAGIGNEVIFLSNNNKFYSKVIRGSTVTEMRPGLFMPSCVENDIKIGYLKEAELSKMVEGKNLEFKIYSNRHPLEASLNEEQLNLIKSFISK